MQTADAQPNPCWPGESALRQADTTTPDSTGLREVVRAAKLMIVDDDPVTVKAVQAHLRRIGHETFVTTSDPTEVIGLIHRESPDLLLLDVAMPQLSGIELLGNIRSKAYSKDLPVIILTAHSDAATKQAALDAGATDFLAKPVDPNELAMRVRNVLVAKAFFDERARRLEDEIAQKNTALAAARDEAELRYQAGKAEIATDVLHNVGNALQSVNTGLNLLAYTVRESKLPKLQRAVDLLLEHRDSLPRFFSTDPRGEVLPSYLRELASALLDDREKLKLEIETVSKHLGHINAVVATQQKYAALRNVFEQVCLSELVNDVVELVGESLANQQIELLRDMKPMPAVNTDRQKLMQVLLNIIKNAVEAIGEAHPNQEGGRLELRCGSLDERHAEIAVIDNGVGIPSEKLIDIFAHGYTTKQTGHGFGLHSCANIIREMGGRIEVESDGIGRGATFRMKIPFEVEGGTGNEPAM